MFRITKRLRQTILSVAGALIVGYFLYHTLQGGRGWFEVLRLQQQVRDSQNTLSQLQKEHQDLDRRIHMMRPDSLDPDLLDEESRKALDYTKPNEVIILTPPEKKKE